MKARELPQWSDFWQQGFVTTFGPGMPDNYQGATADFWRAQLESLDNGARILDIACGNGAIAIIAAAVSKETGKDFHITACDLADIHENVAGSDEINELRGTIKFHSKVANEKLPFKPGSFDLVVSHYGVEYGDLPHSISEIRRVLAPGGSFVALAHHSDSPLLQAARSESKAYIWVLKELNLLGRVRAYFSALGNPKNQQELQDAMIKARPLSTSVNEGVAAMKQRLPNSDCAKQIHAAINHLAQGAARVESRHRLRTLNAVAQEFDFASDRLKDMVRAGLDDSSIDKLKSLAVTSAFGNVFCQPFNDENGKLLAWHIELS